MTNQVRYEPVQNIRDLREGDIVQHVHRGEGYIIVRLEPTHAVAVRTISVSHLDEWRVMRRGGTTR